MNDQTIRSRFTAAFASMLCSLALIAFAALPAQTVASGGLIV